MSGLAVTEAEIVVGPDPSMVFGDQGEFQGFWPAGIVLELRDPRSGTWTELGDISTESRFDVADPEAAVSPSGRIEVRFVGTENLDPSLGMPTVFVSAAVAGVIDR